MLEPTLLYYKNGKIHTWNWLPGTAIQDKFYNEMLKSQGVLELMKKAFCVTCAKLVVAMGSSSKLSKISVWGTPNSSRNNCSNSPFSHVKRLSWSVWKINMLIQWNHKDLIKSIQRLQRRTNWMKSSKLHHCFEYTVTYLHYAGHPLPRQWCHCYGNRPVNTPPTSPAVT
jgi:hypothetical protein